MSVIIRLQNLPWSANALDIRQFFHGLSIPEGGVHIVGGEQGDAFIAFSTDEDARQAFQRNSGRIKEIQITLSLSSRTEMQRVIEAARTQSFAAFMQPQPMPAPIPAIVPAAIPEIKTEQNNSSRDSNSKESKDSKESSRSDRRSDRKRSRSRDRRDRSRDRDRRRRDRSRTRSRDRRDSRRRRDSRSRDTSRSRDRSRDKSRDRKSRDRKRSNDRSSSQSQKKIDVWAQNETIPPAPQPPSILSFSALDDPRSGMGAVNPQAFGASPLPLMTTNLANVAAAAAANRGRESWPPINNMNNLNMPNNNDRFGNNSNSNPAFNNNLPPGFGNQRNSFPMHPNDRPESRSAPSCCVKIQPFYGSQMDVRKLFQGLFIGPKGIKFIYDKFGNETGVVFVQFAQPHIKFEAIRKHNQHYNGKMLSITSLEDIEFENAEDRPKPPPIFDLTSDDDHKPLSNNMKQFNPRSKNVTKYFNQKPDPRVDPRIEPKLLTFSCLRIEDLPTFVKEQDILKIFSSYPLTSLILLPKGRGSHLAYVKFSNPDDAKRACDDKNQHFVGTKQVTVRPCSDKDFDEVNSQHEAGINIKSTPTIQTDCLRLSGLPTKINDRDISDFFSDIGLMPTKIHLISNNLGFTGQAYCEFSNEEESTAALKKDGTLLGSQIVEVKPIDRFEMEGFLDQTERDIMDTLPPKLNMQGPIRPDFRMRMPNMMPPPMNQGNRPPPFFMRNNFDGGNRPPRFMGPRGGPPIRPPRHNQFNNGGGGGDGDDMIHPGCTVFMDNVPYKAGTNEILNFFEGYNVTNNVSRRFNPNNMPSGEAKVVFPTPDDAFIAVKELHLQKIWDRQIYLSQG